MSKSREVFAALEESFISHSKAYLEFPSSSLRCDPGEHRVNGYSIIQVKKADGSGFQKVRVDHSSYGPKLRGPVVRAVGMGFAPGDARSKASRSRLDSLIHAAISGAKDAIAAKESDPGLPEEVRREEKATRERQKGRAYSQAVRELEGLLSGALSSASEEELVRIYRELRIREVMGA